MKISQIYPWQRHTRALTHRHTDTHRHTPTHPATAMAGSSRTENAEGSSRREDIWHTLLAFPLLQSSASSAQFPATSIISNAIRFKSITLQTTLLSLSLSTKQKTPKRRWHDHVMDSLSPGQLFPSSSSSSSSSSGSTSCACYYSTIGRQGWRPRDCDRFLFLLDDRVKYFENFHSHELEESPNNRQIIRFEFISIERIIEKSAFMNFSVIPNVH